MDTITIYRDNRTGDVYADVDEDGYGFDQLEVGGRLSRHEQVEAYAYEYHGWGPDHAGISAITIADFGG